MQIVDRDLDDGLRGRRRFGADDLLDAGENEARAQIKPRDSQSQRPRNLQEGTVAALHVQGHRSGVRTRRHHQRQQVGIVAVVEIEHRRTRRRAGSLVDLEVEVRDRQGHIRNTFEVRAAHTRLDGGVTDIIGGLRQAVGTDVAHQHHAQFHVFEYQRHRARTHAGGLDVRPDRQIGHVGKRCAVAQGEVAAGGLLESKTAVQRHKAERIQFKGSGDLEQCTLFSFKIYCHAGSRAGRNI